METPVESFDPAANFYGTPGEAASATSQETAETAQDAIAAAIYGDESDLDFLNPPPEIAAERAGRGQSMFSDGDNAQGRLTVTKAVEVITPDMPAVLVQANAKEYSAIANDLGILPEGVAEIAKAARDAFSDGNPSEQTLATWKETSQRLMYRAGPRLVAEARRVISRDPRLVTMLNTTRLGNHPVIVRQVLAAAARRLSARK